MHENSLHFWLIPFHEKKSQWEYQTVDCIGLNFAAFRIGNRTLVVLGRHQLTFYGVRVETFTFFTTDGPRAL